MAIDEFAPKRDRSTLRQSVPSFDEKLGAALKIADAPNSRGVDPARVGNVMLGAVDQLCEQAATEIEQAAEDLMQEAHKARDELTELARLVRECGTSANAQMSAFVNFVTSITTTAHNIKDQFTNETAAAEKIAAAGNDRRGTR